MTVLGQSANRIAVTCVVVLMLLIGTATYAQNLPRPTANIKATLVAEGPAIPGQELYLAIHFQPKSNDWHGYWSNPGDAGYGMELDWTLPDGWKAGEPLYPVPKRLLISDLMNHVYEGDYAVLIPLSVPVEAAKSGVVQVSVDAQWLACTDEICVPEGGSLELTVPVGDGAFGDRRFANWRAAIPPVIDSVATFTTLNGMLRLGIPIPEAVGLSAPHVFLANRDLVQYAGVQTFTRNGDMLVAEIPSSNPDARIEAVEGILAFDQGQGVRFRAEAGDVPDLGISNKLNTETAPTTSALALLLLAALAGGLILNVMPCVFPILSLKAISLARAGGSEAQARSEGIAYTAGVILACVALGGLMLAFRAAGQQVGWAFQLQEPWVVIALLVLAVAITANFADLFELPSLSFTRSGEPASAFATGLLAAFAATPCTGPFMAAALGAALLLPVGAALSLFAALGLGLALPFLLIGLVPALRRMLPKPGAWMERFRKAMAIPMGLTALALIWLTARLGSQSYALIALIFVGGLLIAFAVVGRLQKRGKMAWPAFALIAAPFAIFAAFALPASYSSEAIARNNSLLEPIRFTGASLQAARSTGKPVFVWFTADWCLTCKVNEGIAIEREETRKAFEEAEVIAIRGDWTRRDPQITEFLTKQGVAGIPLYVWYAPDGEAQILPQVLTPNSLVTLAQGSPMPTAGSDPAVLLDVRSE